MAEDVTISDTGYECPYCGHTTGEIECEDYNEYEHVEECEECGKKYHACETFSIDHRARPDCALNGEEHDYVAHAWLAHRFCAICHQIERKPR